VPASGRIHPEGDRRHGPGLGWEREIRHTGVVKFAGVSDGAASGDRVPDRGVPERGVSEPGAQGERRTRSMVMRLILQHGPMTAAALGERLELSAAAIRRHLDALVGEGTLVEVEPRGTQQRRGRGRPARAYALTDAGRSSFEQAYDDLASTALRYLRQTGGEPAVRAFADHRAQTLAARINDRSSTDGGALTDLQTTQRAEALVAALNEEGFAADVTPATKGLQICQHHCPVAHVAAEFPELCEAETRALAEVLGTYVQRLATIAHGDGVCTTHVPLNQQPDPLHAEVAIAPTGRQM
jgi:predicted ArsR family transcriptional regulator